MENVPQSEKQSYFQEEEVPSALFLENGERNLEKAKRRFRQDVSRKSGLKLDFSNI